MAAVEQRLCSGGNGGCGVLGLGAVIAWEMGLLVRRGWLKRQSRRSRRAGQQGKLAGDLGEMDAGAARSGWRGRKGTLTCGPALVSGQRVRSVRGRPSGLSAGVRWAERSRPRGKERGAELAEGERGRGLERVLREAWSRAGEKEKKGWAAGNSPGRAGLGCWSSREEKGGLLKSLGWV